MTEEVVYDEVDPKLKEQEDDVDKTNLPEDDDDRIKSAALPDEEE